MGQVDPQLLYFLMDSQNASDSISFSQKMNDLMSKLAEITYVIPKTYATSTVIKAWSVGDNTINGSV